MTENEKLEQLIDGFNKLPEEGKEHILTILQSLMFAQNSRFNLLPKDNTNIC